MCLRWLGFDYLEACSFDESHVIFRAYAEAETVCWAWLCN